VQCVHARDTGEPGRFGQHLRAIPALLDRPNGFGPLRYLRTADEQLLRARVLSLFLCGTLAVYGRHEELPALERESIAGLDRTVRTH